MLERRGDLGEERREEYKREREREGKRRIKRRKEMGGMSEVVGPTGPRGKEEMIGGEEMRRSVNRDILP